MTNTATVGSESQTNNLPANTAHMSTGAPNYVAPIIDHNHPLFLQPNDTPGSSLISIQLTGSENYAL